MRKTNAENERIKRRYLQYLKEAKRLSDVSVDKAAWAIALFERSTSYKPFKKFHIEQTVTFKRRLSETTNQKTGKPLSKATIAATLRALKAFFQWLSDQPGYRSRLSYSDCEYFSVSAKDARIASAVRHIASPPMEHALHALRLMPSSTEIERRDRALFAFLILTAARDGAIVSLKLKHVDLLEGCVYQDAREVNTKASKTFTTWFFPVDHLVLRIFEDWVTFLEKTKFFGPNEPLFPKPHMGLRADGQFATLGISKDHWSDAGPVRRIVKAAFRYAGLAEYGPHTIRKTLTRYGLEKCERIVDLKAWSENLGHEHLITTTQNYGKLGPQRQAEIMRRLRNLEKG